MQRVNGGRYDLWYGLREREERVVDDAPRLLRSSCATKGPAAAHWAVASCARAWRKCHLRCRVLAICYLLLWLYVCAGTSSSFRRPSSFSSFCQFTSSSSRPLPPQPRPRERSIATTGLTTLTQRAFQPWPRSLKVRAASSRPTLLPSLAW